jgi:hypothetical protein
MVACRLVAFFDGLHEQAESQVVQRVIGADDAKLYMLKKLSDMVFHDRKAPPKRNTDEASFGVRPPHDIGAVPPNAALQRTYQHVMSLAKR